MGLTFLSATSARRHGTPNPDVGCAHFSLAPSHSSVVSADLHHAKLHSVHVDDQCVIAEQQSHNRTTRWPMMVSNNNTMMSSPLLMVAQSGQPFNLLPYLFLLVD